MLSLHEFGERAGCDHTTASRLRSGDRAPSTRLLNRICQAFDLDRSEALQILAEDQQTGTGQTPRFAEYLRTKVFEVPDDVTSVTSDKDDKETTNVVR
jgi:transcriptional regulator with XRE-family HTH domain